MKKKAEPTQPLKRTSKKWCECGYKRHGKNHDQGSHHKQTRKEG